MWEAIIEVIIQYPKPEGGWGLETREVVSHPGRTQRDAKESLSDRVAQVVKGDRWPFVTWPEGSEVISIDLTHAPKMERVY